MSALVDPVVLDDHEPVLRVGGGDVAGEVRIFGRARIECGYGVWTFEGYCAYRVRDVEVGNAGWEIAGPIGSGRSAQSAV